MKLINAVVNLDEMLCDLVGKFKRVFPSVFLPLSAQSGILVSCLNIEVEISVAKSELEGMTSVAEVRAFLRQRILDNIAGTINPLCDELEGK